jgi:hypothetical protein
MGFTKEEAHALTRLQVAMWVDGSLACPVCKRPFESVDDYLARNPRAGNDTRDGFFAHYKLKPSKRGRKSQGVARGRR